MEEFYKEFIIDHVKFCMTKNSAGRKVYFKKNLRCYRNGRGRFVSIKKSVFLNAEKFFYQLKQKNHKYVKGYY